MPLPADMGNRLFPCLHLPSELQALRATSGLHDRLTALTTALRQVAKAIDDLNAKAVVMTWNHLRRTPLSRVICAGAGKRSALLTVLLAAYFDGEKGTTPLVKELSTDQKSAEPLLDELAIIQEDNELRSWYEERLTEFGLVSIPH
jgi:hypothetical protein